MKLNILPALISGGIGGALTFLVTMLCNNNDLTSIITVYLANIILMVMCFGISTSDSRRTVNIRTLSIVFFLIVLTVNIFLLSYDVRYSITIATNLILVLSCLGISYSISKAK